MLMCIQHSFLQRLDVIISFLAGRVKGYADSSGAYQIQLREYADLSGGGLISVHIEGIAGLRKPVRTISFADMIIHGHSFHIFLE